MKNKKLFILALLVNFFSSNGFSKLTIGFNLKAYSGALLDLKDDSFFLTKEEGGNLII